MTRTVILDGARTPFGKLGGGLASLSAAQLGGKAIKAAMEKANIEPKDVQQVIMGHVLQGGQGQLTARQAAREAGLPWHVKAECINKVCASGLRSVTLADQIIRAGDENVIISGGMESMSNTPYFLPKVRTGLRMGDSVVKDMMVHDGLTCSFTGVHMGIYGGSTALDMNIPRKAQDEWALRSHKLAIEAIDNGKLKEEITPVEIPQKKGDSLYFSEDEAPRRESTLEALEKLKPAFQKNGTITAGNAPGVNDGAAALVLMSEERAEIEGRDPKAWIIGNASIAVNAKDFPKTPGLVINEILQKTGKSLDEVDLFEINEAFAVVALAGEELANLDREKINVNGGAVALGHPIGASGTRIILTLINELERRGGGIGIAAICSGGGQGDAIMIEVPKK